MRTLLTYTLLLLALNLNAQKNTFKLSYSPVQFLKMDKEWLHSHDNDKSSYSGAFTLDYYRHINERIKIGLSASYETASYEDKRTGSYQPPYPNHNNIIDITYTSSQKYRYFSFGPQLIYHYINNDQFKLGSAISLVLLHNTTITTFEFQEEKSSKIDAFAHLELLSFTWGKTNGLTGQLGFGHKGLVSLGYFFSF
ncbi:hypothetical protein [Carboxylicivirga taeanensis]|uniref:hypothetical protein n=1 Tax=Carboxylicivirga taeanensis TaxID=1416875 RepID=UPI003F6DF85A